MAQCLVSAVADPVSGFVDQDVYVTYSMEAL